MRFGVVSPIHSTRSARQFAVAAEDAGFWAVGVPDTAPLLYHGAYPLITACTLATSRLKVGTFVTNPVTRHWSIHTSNARALTELGSGRFFLGLSTGDGAVHSIGLKPATWVEVEQFTAAFKAATANEVPVFIATAGPRGSVVAGRVASEAVFSQGLDATALRTAINRADRARAEAGVVRQLGKWTNVQICLVTNEAEVGAVRGNLRGRAYGLARYSFAYSFDEKNIPAEWQPILRERLAQYDYAFHGSSAPNNPNSRLFEDRPDIETYLIDRLCVVGSAHECAQRLGNLALEVGLDGIWLGVRSPMVERDPIHQLGPVAEALRGLMSSSH